MTNISTFSHSAAFVAIALAIGATSVASAQQAASVAASAAHVDLPAALKEFQLQEYGTPARELVPNWTAPRKLVVTVDSAERTAWLQQAMPKGVTVVGIRKASEAEPHLADADALISAGCRADMLAKAPKLKWIHAGGGGSDQCLAIPAVASGKIVMTNNKKVKNSVLAEMAMGYVLALSRSIDVSMLNQVRGDLNAEGGRPAKQLEGSTMLVVGLGGAGTEIARIANSMGMKVIATRNSSREKPDFVSYVGLSNETADLVGQADVIVICAPLTPATRGLFNAAMFSRMKKDAMVVNWTRAELTVPEDLAAALKAGTIGSAALNWATAAPLPKTHPLWGAPNLILAPWAGTGGGAEANRANRSEESNEMRWLVVRENMRRFAAGDKMYSVFDLTRGY